MKSVELLKQHNGKKISRKKLEEIVSIAKEENAVDIIYRVSKVLNKYPNLDYFEIELNNYDYSLSGSQHKGSYKEALDDCGRLKKGWKFLNGNVVKVEKKPAPKKQLVKQKTTSKKPEDLTQKIYNLEKKYNLTSVKFPKITSLKGVYLADGHSILTDEEKELYGSETGLNASAQSVEEIINNLILEKIKNEELPTWKQSWASSTPIPAQNFETKKEYTGSNAMILNVLLGSIMKSPYYLTAKQIEKMGGKIKKGAKSVPLVYYNFSHSLKDLSKAPDKEAQLLNQIKGLTIKGKKITHDNYAGVTVSEKVIEEYGIEKEFLISRGFLMYYRVFNIVDTTGIEYTLPTIELKPHAEKIDICEKIIKSFKECPAIVPNIKEAFYNIQSDIVAIPDIKQFENEEEYYSTLFHEIVHSTLHESRLNRIEKYKGKDKEVQYAFEELIAELGASYLCGVAGIIDVVHLNSASYLKNWHERLQELTGTYSDFLIFATKEAQKAVDYILKDFDDKAPVQPTYSEKEKALAKAKALKLKLKLKIK